MKEESNHWFEALRSEGEGYHKAYSELRLFLLRSLTKSMGSKPGVNAAFLEDVVQDACLLILKKIDTYQGRSKFSSWALSIAIRVALSEFRKKQWSNVSLDDLREKGASFEMQHEQSPYQKTALLGAVETLHELIATRLTEKQRTVLLAELTGMPQDQLAEQLNTTRNALYKVFHDARKALKRELQSVGYDQETVLEMLNYS